MLRLGVMHTSPVLVSRNPESGDIGGIAVDLASDLARRLNVPLQVVPYATTAEMLNALEDSAWDVAFFAYHPEHRGVCFTAPFLESDGTYLVPSGSQVSQVADVDQDHMRVAVSANSALDLHLTRALRHAHLIRVPGAPAAAELLRAGKANVLAGIRQQLHKVAATLSGSKVLKGRFTVIQHALAFQAGRAAAVTTYLNAFIEDVKASGLAARVIEENGIKGVSVAPAARSHDRAPVSKWDAA
jgi:polar amino acid transport system substrate-binding protein